jgi:hypothetical protein
MVEAVFKFLIMICLVAICVFLIIWVLAEIGLGIPGTVEKIIYVIAVLVVLLFAYRTFKPYLS